MVLRVRSDNRLAERQTTSPAEQSAAERSRNASRQKELLQEIGDELTLLDFGADSQCSLKSKETAAKVKQTAVSPSCAVESESNKSLTEETVSPSPTPQQTLPTALTPAIAGRGEGGPSCSMRVFAADYDSEESDQDGPEEDPFDPGPIDPDKEPDLYPPDSHDNWVQLKQQALKEGDFEIAERIIAPVIYQGSRGQNAWWEQLSFSEIKELQ
ncbi:hypothetical protein HGM15179_017601 [Zosterops borbonicus]|uniref:Uncharacterized protein n=1 Tax=Zosterops borbonicus TaxID=364589 RepID=A0A8K1G0P6_9PASS|nr:hypothetical protein HGM15179_017601 [Zosterops borbonicus]